MATHRNKLLKQNFLLEPLRSPAFLASPSPCSSKSLPRPTEWNDETCATKELLDKHCFFKHEYVICTSRSGASEVINRLGNLNQKVAPTCPNLHQIKVVWRTVVLPILAVAVRAAT